MVGTLAVGGDTQTGGPNRVWDNPLPSLHHRGHGQITSALVHIGAVSDSGFQSGVRGPVPTDPVSDVSFGCPSDQETGKDQSLRRDERK